MANLRNQFAFFRTFLVRSNPDFEVSEIDNDFKIVPVTFQNVEDAEWFNSPDLIKAFKFFLTKGYQGYYVFINGKCAHRIWIFNDSERTYLGDMFKFDIGNELMVAWGLTSKEFRGKGIYQAVLSFLIQKYPGQYIYGAVEPKNLISLKGLLNNGFTIHKQLLLIRVWRIKLWVQYKKEGRISINFGFGGMVK